MVVIKSVDYVQEVGVKTPLFIAKLEVDGEPEEFASKSFTALVTHFGVNGKRLIEELIKGNEVVV